MGHLGAKQGEVINCESQFFFHLFGVFICQSFCIGCTSSNIWQEQLPKMLEGRSTPMVTNCVLEELRGLGDRALGAAIIAKGWLRRNVMSMGI